MEQCLLACGGRRVGLPSFCTVVLGPLFSRGTQISVRAVRHLLGAPLGITQFVCFGILIEQCLFLACHLLMEQCLLDCGGRRGGLPSLLRDID